MKLMTGLMLLLLTACSPQVSDPVTSFGPLNLSDNYGRSQVITRAHHQWRLINFWATWCQPCREEMPALQQLSQQLARRLDIVIVSVDEDSNLVKEFLYKYQLTMASYITSQSVLEQQFSITQYPTTFLVSPQGKVAEIFIGARDWNSPEIIKQLERHFGS